MCTNIFQTHRFRYPFSFWQSRDWVSSPYLCQHCFDSSNEHGNTVHAAYLARTTIHKLTAVSSSKVVGVSTTVMGADRILAKVYAKTALQVNREQVLPRHIQDEAATKRHSTQKRVMQILKRMRSVCGAYPWVLYGYERMLMWAITCSRDFYSSTLD